jgi:hypothetical protein
MHKMLCWIVLVLREMDEKKQVNSTSQQIGSLLRLRFQLKSFNGTSFADVPGVVALSQPIEVFSHTHYLNNKKKVLFMFFFLCVCGGGGSMLLFNLLFAGSETCSPDDF